MNFKLNKLLMLLMILLLSLALVVGCGGDNEEAAAENPAENEEAAENDEEDEVDEEDENDEEADEEEEAIDTEELVDRVTRAYFDSITTENSTWNMMAFDAALENVENNPEDYFVVDMRGEEDYAEGHFPGAVHIPYNQIADHMDRLPADKTILVYCFTGQTSGQAIAAMQLMGFDAISLQGGMNFGWATLELDDELLETEGTDLPESSNDWNEEQEVLIVEIHRYFTQGMNYIVRPDDELLETLEGDVAVLDIRNEEVFEEGHIENAFLIPFGELGERMDEIPNDKPVYVTCFSGQTAGQAILNLRLNGIDAYSLYRGMAGWNAEEMPVVTP